MIKTTLAATLIMAAATAAPAATFVFDAAGGNGSGSQAVDQPSEFALTLLGANGVVANSVAGRTTYTATAASDQSFDIAWSFFTFDRFGPAADPFGFFVGATDTQLSDDSGTGFQNGEFTLTVTAGDVFGFYIDSTDDVNGPGFATVVGTEVPSAVVPLPASGGLLIGSLIGFGLYRRRGCRA